MSVCPEDVVEGHAQIVKEPLPKKCDIKGLRMKVTVPNKTLQSSGPPHHSKYARLKKCHARFGRDRIYNGACSFENINMNTREKTPL